AAAVDPGVPQRRPRRTRAGDAPMGPDPALEHRPEALRVRQRPGRDRPREAGIPRPVQVAALPRPRGWVLRVEDPREEAQAAVFLPQGRGWAAGVCGDLGPLGRAGRDAGDGRGADHPGERTGPPAARPNASNRGRGALRAVARPEGTPTGEAPALAHTLPGRADGVVAGQRPGELGQGGRTGTDHAPRAAGDLDPADAIRSRARMSRTINAEKDTIQKKKEIIVSSDPVFSAFIVRLNFFSTASPASVPLRPRCG